MVSIEAAGLPIATIRTRNTDAPEVFITHVDHLRSTRLVTTEGAGLGAVNIVEETDYDAFGKITRHEQTGDFAEKKKFTSHEFDVSTSYTYAKARYLNTEAGRFLSQDKAFLELGSSQLAESFEKSAFAGQYIANRLQGVDDTRAALETILKDPQALNSYTYARNNPIRYIDPTGKEYFEISGSITYGFGTAGAGFRIDSRGIDWFTSGGAAYGVGLNLQAGFSSGDLSHVPEIKVSQVGKVAYGVGVSVSREADPNSYDPLLGTDAEWEVSGIAGFGASVSEEWSYSHPIKRFGSQDGPAELRSYTPPKPHEELDIYQTTSQTLRPSQSPVRFGQNGKPIYCGRFCNL